MQTNVSCNSTTTTWYIVNKREIECILKADSNTQQHFCWRNNTWVELCKILSLVYMHIWGLYLLPDYVCLIRPENVTDLQFQNTIIKEPKGPKKSTIFQSWKKIEDVKFLRSRFFLLCSLHDDTIQGPLIKDGRNSNEMLIFPTDITRQENRRLFPTSMYLLWHF